MATLTVHGCRGSTAFDTGETKEFGGNSSCYTLQVGNDIIILDAGTGLLRAQRFILPSNPDNVYLVLSHEHLDHIEGIGTSALSYIPGMNLKIYGRQGVRKGLENIFPSVNFPIGLDREMVGIAEINEVDGLFQIGDIVVKEFKGNHQKDGCSAYRFHLDNGDLVYATDQEFSYDYQGNKLDDSLKDRYKAFIQGAELLIADAHFTKEEYVDEKPIKVKGWGHCYPEEILDMAAQAGVKNVLLTHHKPDRSDIEVSRLEIAAHQHCTNEGYNFKFVEYAMQGIEYDL